MAIDMGGIEVYIKLNNGDLVTGIVQSKMAAEQMGQVVENSLNKGTRATGVMGKAVHDLGTRFGRAFGIGAVITTAIVAIRALFSAVADGVKRAIANNSSLSASLTRMNSGIESIFTKIGTFLTPLIERVVDVYNKIRVALNLSQDLPKRDVKTITSDLSSGLISEKKALQELKEYSMTSKDIVKNQERLDQLRNKNTQLIQTETGLIETKKALEKDGLETSLQAYQVNILLNKNLEDIKKNDGEIVDLTKQLTEASAANLAIDEIRNKKAKERKELTDAEKKAMQAQVAIAEGLVGELKNLIPNSEFGELGSKIASIVGKMKELTEAGQNAGQALTAAISAGWVGIVIAAFGALVNLMQGIVDAGNAQHQANIEFENAKVIQQTEEWVRNLTDAYTDLKDAVAVLEFNASKESKIRNDSVEAIKDEIDEKQKLFDSNKKLADQAKDAVEEATVVSKYGLSTDYGAQDSYRTKAKELTDQIAGYEGSAAYWDKKAIEAASTGQGEAAIIAMRNAENYRRLFRELGADATKLNALAGMLETGSTAYLENIDLGYELNDLEKERLEFMTKQTEELRKQTREYLSQLDKVGLLDKENIGSIMFMASELQKQGITGLAQLTELSDLGVRNSDAARYGTNIGRVQVIQYNSTGNNASLDSIIGDAGGGNA